MNILILSWRGPGHPHAGGAETSSHEHAVGWVKAGHNVTLFTSSFKGAKEREDVDGVHIIRKGAQVFQVHLRAMLWYLFSPHPKFDIVIDEVHGIPFFTPIFVRARKLVFIHEVAKEVWKLNPWPKPFNLIPAVIGTVLEPLIFKLIYRKTPFMTVSKSTKDDLVAWGIPYENITVVHNGFSNKFLKEKNEKKILSSGKDDKKIVMYLGALSKDKGIEDALTIFKDLLNIKDPSQPQANWQFWVVGKADPNYLKFLQKRSNNFGINRNIKFFGMVSEKEKYNLLSRAHVLINPSAREGWGLVVIEAASVGTPTVAYNVAGLRDSVKDNETGLLSLANPEDCAKKIIDLFNDSKLYAFLSNNSLRWSKKFSWEKSSEESLNLLTKLTSVST